MRDQRGFGQRGRGSAPAGGGGGASRAPKGAAQAPAWERVYGVNAVLALHARRPDDIQRIWYVADVGDVLAPVLRRASQRGITHQEAAEHELTKVAESVHHEGVCVWARARRLLTVREFAAALRAQKGAGLVLDRVGNPHNLGAILRSSAYFGCAGVLLAQGEGQAQLGSAAVRTAEGGAEHVPIARAQDLVSALSMLRAEGITVVGTDPRAEASALGYAWRLPCVLVMGNEREGLSDEVRRLCDGLVAIPGTGAVESLNVSVAAGVVLAELYRARHG